VIGEIGFGVSLHGSNPKPLMSALGQKRTSTHVRVMSALPPKADIHKFHMAPHGYGCRFTSCDAVFCDLLATLGIFAHTDDCHLWTVSRT